MLHAHRVTDDLSRGQHDHQAKHDESADISGDAVVVKVRGQNGEGCEMGGRGEPGEGGGNLERVDGNFTRLGEDGDEDGDACGASVRDGALTAPRENNVPVPSC